MNLKRNKNFGFTLMEIMISLAIVAILVLVTLPVINKQLEKADEYSYYLAYKTVEKMAGQIVAIGDPTELADSNNIIIAESDDKSVKDLIAEKLSNNKITAFFDSLGSKFAKTEAYIFKAMFPKAFALSYSNTVHQWSSAEYDDLWLSYKVCSPSYDPNNSNTCVIKSKSIQTVTNEDGSTSEQTIYHCYTRNDVFGPENADQGCVGLTESKKYSIIGEDGKDYGYTVSAHSNLASLVLNLEYCSSSNLTTLGNYIMNSSAPNASSFCYYSAYKTACGGSKTVNGTTYNMSTAYQYSSSGDDSSYGEDEGEEGGLAEGEEFVEPPASPVGDCFITASYYVPEDTGGSSVVPAEKPTFGSEWCSPAYGYYNMVNNSDGSTIDCACKSSYVMSTNDEKVCCQKCSEGSKPYAKPNHSCICCETDFNKNEGTCCPEFSVYNDGEGACTCIEGYKMQGGVCIEDECTPGSTMVDGVCVVNPPITKASRFCEQVKEYWNISDSYCSGFTSTNNIQYYQAVYNAAVGTNGTLMSIKSKSGAFGVNADGSDKIKPNIVFTNGLKMWILSDKTASIPGLSFTTENATPSRNVCQNLKKSTHLSCNEAGGWFCKAEKNCFALDAESKALMGDARNCCGSVDITDIAAKAQTTADPDAYLKNTQAYAISGFTVFVDINGDKGNGTLWDDVYPFYIGANGTVYPAYPLDAPKGANAATSLYLGGNSSKQLPVDVYYYEATDDSRQKKVAFSGVSFARGVCSARQISKYTPYCLNLGEKFSGKGLDNHTLPTDYIKYDDVNATGSEKSYNPCDKYKCFVSVRRKLRTF